MEEVWKEVPGYEGRYKVSNKGVVKSLLKNKKTLKFDTNKKGYKLVKLYKSGYRNNFLVHRLMACAFLNFALNDKSKVVDHFDEDTSNNTLGNLRVITHRENTSRSTKGKSGLNGASPKRGGFRSTIYIGKQQIYLGQFLSAKESNEIYKKAVLNLHLFVDREQFKKLLNEL